MTLAVQNAPTSLDPAKNNNTWDQIVPDDLGYESLIYQQPDGTYTPGLALTWGYIGAGNTTFQLQLRPGVKFDDGTAVTADAVVKSLQYAQASSGANAGNLKGAVFTATGPLTVQIKMAGPNPDLAELFSQTQLVGDIISPAGLANASGLGTSTAGAGPYTLDASATVSGSTYTFIRNPNFFDKSRQGYGKIVLKVFADPTAALQAAKAGQVDFTFGEPKDATSAKSAGLSVYSVTTGWVGIFITDHNGTQTKALGDVRVRQAISYAMDRAAIAKALYGDYAHAFNQIVLPGFVGYDASLNGMYQFDLAKAKSLMAEAGYSNGFTMSLISTPARDTDLQAQAFAQQMKQIKIKVNIVSAPDFSGYVGDLSSNKYSALIGTYDGLPLSSTVGNVLAPTGIFNPRHDTDTQMLALAQQAAAAPADQSAALYQQVEQRQLAIAWTPVMMSLDAVFFASPKVKNIAISPTNSRSFDPDPSTWVPGS